MAEPTDGQLQPPPANDMKENGPTDAKLQPPPADDVKEKGLTDAQLQPPPADDVKEKGPSKKSSQAAALLWKLAESGEKKVIKEWIRQKLVESGWREKMREEVENYVQGEKGMELASVDEMLTELEETAYSHVPPGLQEILYDKIQFFFNERMGRESVKPPVLPPNKKL